jgi:rubrerythrin
MPEFVNPFSGVVPRPLSKTELARAIMLDIGAELEAIHLYQAHIDATDDELAKAVLAHVRDEEKEHVGDFMALLEHLDPSVASALREGHEEVAEMYERVKAGLPAEQAAAIEDGGAEPAGGEPPAPLVLGDLRGSTA